MKEKFLKKSSILIIGEIFTKILGIIYLFPLQRVDADLGQLMADLYIPYSFILVFAAVGINNVMTDEVSKYANDEKKLKKSLQNGLLFTVITGSIASIVLFLLSAPLMNSLATDASMYTKEAIIGTKQLAVAVVLFAITNYMRAVLMGFGKVTPVAISYIGEQVVRVLIILVGVYYVITVQGNGIESSVEIFTISTIASILITFFYFVYCFIKEGYFKYYFHTKYYFSRKKLLYITATGFVFFINGLFITAFDQYDLIMFNLQLDRVGMSINEIGYLKNILFSWSQKIVNIPIGLTSAFLSMMIYYFNDPDSGPKESLKLIRLIYVYALISCAAFWIFGNDLFNILYDTSQIGMEPGYPPGQVLMMIQSFIIPFYVMRTVISVYVLLNNRKDKVFISNLLVLIVKPILNIVLIFTIGYLLKEYLFIASSIIVLTFFTVALVTSNKSLFDIDKEKMTSYIILTLEIVFATILIIAVQSFIPVPNHLVGMLRSIMIAFPILGFIILREVKRI